MSKKISHLSVLPPKPPEVNAALIETLELALTYARQGQLQTLAGVARGGTEYWIINVGEINDDLFHTVGLLEQLKLNLLGELNGEQCPVLA
jgi:hypothetical protein